MPGQELIAKSANGKISVDMKEKYGVMHTYSNLTVIMKHDNSFYLNNRDGIVAILPLVNWSIVSLSNPDDTE